MEEIVRIFEELNFPSSQKLKRVLRQRGIAFTAQQVDQLAKGETTRQVQAPAPQLTGKIAAERLNDVWFADLIDLTATPSDGGRKADLDPTKAGMKYVLVVQDVFSRRLFALPLLNKRPETVLEAFKTILDESGERCEQLVVDKGGEFQSSFKEFVEAQGIQFTTKDNLRQIATLDVAIGYLKKAMVRDARKARTDDWASRLDKVVRGQNAVPNDDYLEGNAPADVPGSAALIDKLEAKNREFVAHNAEQVEERENKLREAGHFRVLISQPTPFVRGHKPRWSEKVHTVDTVTFDKVTDTEGNTFKTKFVLPVADRTDDAGPRRMERGGSEQTDLRRMRILNSFADRVYEHFGAGRTVSASRIGQFLQTLNFRQSALEARLNMKSPVVSFLKLFPGKFEVKTLDGQILVRFRPPILPGYRRLRRAVVD